MTTNTTSSQFIFYISNYWQSPWSYTQYVNTAAENGCDMSGVSMWCTSYLQFSSTTQDGIQQLMSEIYGYDTTKETMFIAFPTMEQATKCRMVVDYFSLSQIENHEMLDFLQIYRFIEMRFPSNTTK